MIVGIYILYLPRTLNESQFCCNTCINAAVSACCSYTRHTVLGFVTETLREWQSLRSASKPSLTPIHASKMRAQQTITWQNLYILACTRPSNLSHCKHQRSARNRITNISQPYYLQAAKIICLQASNVRLLRQKSSTKYCTGCLNKASKQLEPWGDTLHEVATTVLFWICKTNTTNAADQ